MLLESDAHCFGSRYARVFQDAALDDAGLAAELALGDLRELLPEAPLAHCLQLRRLIAESTVRPASGTQNEDGEGKANL